MGFRVEGWDNKDCIRFLLHSYYITFLGWGVLLTQTLLRPQVFRLKEVSLARDQTKSPGPAREPQQLEKTSGGFPKLGSTFLGVPIIRIIIYWGLYWGPLILGNYHIFPKTTNPHVQILIYEIGSCLRTTGCFCWGQSSGLQKNYCTGLKKCLHEFARARFP